MQRNVWKFATLAALLAVAVRVSVGPRTIDDAYITFRYSRNIADGLGFVYNPGEHVLGTTAPLWALILAAFYRLGVQDLPWVALALGALFDAATTLLLFKAAQRLGLAREWAFFAALAFALSAGSVDLATAGMETSLFVLLVVGAATASLSHRPGWAGLAAGLASVTRPEGLMMGAVLLGSAFLRRKVSGRTITAFLLPVVAWSAFATVYFGSPIPETLRTKAVVYAEGTSHALNNAIIILVTLGIPGFNAAAVDTWPGFLYQLFVGVLMVMVATRLAMPRLASLRTRSEALPILAFGPLLAGFYIAAGLRGIPITSYWYLIPLIPFAIVTVVGSLHLMSRKWGRSLVGIAGALLIVWISLGLGLGRSGNSPFFQPVGRHIAREAEYRAAADLLAQAISPQDVVALPEIGAFGYYSNARVLDTIGLVSPQVVRYYPQPGGLPDRIPPDLIRTAQPAYVLGLDVFFGAELTAGDWFQRDYRLFAEIADPMLPLGAKAVRIYKRLAN
ncbi:MAG: hypothetical protein HYY30_01715 [Chloroflexi bacterium]|nr:hypothetical protein [Chloroflexota bacterium]